MAEIQIIYREEYCEMMNSNHCTQCHTACASDLGCNMFDEGKHEKNVIPFGDCIYAKFKYYRLLDGTREKGNWNEWIKFFLQTVTKQCEKYIYIVERINQMYEEHLALAKSLISNNAVVDLINAIYKQPILSLSEFEKETNLSPATVNRYINVLLKSGIIDTDGRKRNRTFFCYELLDVLRL